MLQTKIYRSSL